MDGAADALLAQETAAKAAAPSALPPSAAVTTAPPPPPSGGAASAEVTAGRSVRHQLGEKKDQGGGVEERAVMEQLLLLYPRVDRDSLLQVLRACAGSLRLQNHLPTPALPLPHSPLPHVLAATRVPFCCTHGRLHPFPSPFPLSDTCAFLDSSEVAAEAEAAARGGRPPSPPKSSERHREAAFERRRMMQYYFREASEAWRRGERQRAAALADKVGSGLLQPIRAAEQQVEVERAAGRQAQEAMQSKVRELVDEVRGLTTGPTTPTCATTSPSCTPPSPSTRKHSF
ncbi:unnamed protein product [Closterium sp. Naga37s-1]|nr:unnamed protein product [Closterium sp. Naga37s-1]